MNFSNVFGNLHRLDYREILLFQKSLLKPAFRAVFILHELELFWYLLYKLQSLFKNKTQTFLVFPNIVSLTPLLANNFLIASLCHKSTKTCVAHQSSIRKISLKLIARFLVCMYV